MTQGKKEQTFRERLRQVFRFSWRDCAVCLGVLTATAALCAVLRMFDPSDVYVALIFELAVVLVSRFTDGYLFGLLASVIGVLGVNWIFTYPYMQLNFTIAGYPLTFVVMLAVSVVVSTLTTQIKQQEKLRAEAEKEKMRGNLLRAVSHDIRTPLTAIVGGIDAILENGDQISPETRRGLLENMRDESNWLIGVVENLLSVTRMSGASQIKKELEARRRGAFCRRHEVPAPLPCDEGLHFSAGGAADDPHGYHPHRAGADQPHGKCRPARQNDDKDRPPPETGRRVRRILRLGRRAGDREGAAAAPV